MSSLSRVSLTWPGHCVVLYSRWGYSISVIRIVYTHTHSYLTLVSYYEDVTLSQPLGYSFGYEKYISTVYTPKVPKIMIYFCCLVIYFCTIFVVSKLPNASLNHLLPSLFLSIHMQQGFASLMYDSNNLKPTVSPNLFIWNFGGKKMI